MRVGKEKKAKKILSYYFEKEAVGELIEEMEKALKIQKDSIEKKINFLKKMGQNLNIH